MKRSVFIASILVILLAVPLWAKGPNDSSKSAGLTEIETANILYLFEEEKLAHDIYIEMYNNYSAYIFNTISESEQRHMDSVKKLIVEYGLDDAVLRNDIGKFTNPDIQGEYDRLLAKGMLSLTSALEAGVEIEVMDIADLERMLKVTLKSDIERVMSNLLDGSNNHLDAFQTQLGIAL